MHTQYFKKIPHKNLIAFIDTINRDYKKYKVEIPKDTFKNNTLTNYFDIIQIENDVVVYKFETSFGSAELTVFNILDKHKYYYVENNVLEKKIDYYYSNQ